jgi:hypothetical protein
LALDRIRHEESVLKVLMSDASSAQITRRDDLVHWDHDTAKQVRALLALLMTKKIKAA